MDVNDFERLTIVGVLPSPSDTRSRGDFVPDAPRSEAGLVVSLVRALGRFVGRACRGQLGR